MNQPFLVNNELIAQNKLGIQKATKKINRALELVINTWYLSTLVYILKRK